jgi:dTDP-4-amino-4,6-dideoxygalactose transaminase
MTEDLINQDFQPIFEQKVPLVRPVLPTFLELMEETQELLSSGMVTKGRWLQIFEEAVAQHLGVRNVIAVSSCTTGLMLSYQGLDLTGEVIVPSFTFMATVSALVWADLRPVFADVERETTNLNPEAVEALINPRTSAIVAVHNFGNPADNDALQTLADRHGLKLIFDAAHGFGTRYRGMPVGSQGDVQVFSLSPTKLLIAGEGGIVATNNDVLAEKIRLGREYGNNGHYDSAFAGINARMPEFNALMGYHSLLQLEEAARRRNEIVALYREQLSYLPGLGFQEVRPGNRSSYKDFSITIDPSTFGVTRDELAQALALHNIDTRKYYYPPVHRQTAYRKFAGPDELLPNTEFLALHSLSLPIWSSMDDATVQGICQAIKQTYQSSRSISQDEKALSGSA